MTRVDHPQTVVSVEGERTIRVTRRLNAPRELVFRALTTAEYITQWWGPRAYETVVDSMDVRPGGTWRFFHLGEGGARDEDPRLAFNGEYRVVQPPEVLEYTFEWEGLPGHGLVETITLADNGDGTTTLESTSVFATQQDRDGMLESGMEEGQRQSYERMDELLLALRSEVDDVVDSYDGPKL